MTVPVNLAEPPVEVEDIPSPLSVFSRHGATLLRGIVFLDEMSKENTTNIINDPKKSVEIFF